jgi:hypothetical protein
LGFRNGFFAGIDKENFEPTLGLVKRLVKKCPHITNLNFFEDEVREDAICPPTFLSDLATNIAFLNTGLLEWAARLPKLQELAIGRLLDQHIPVFTSVSLPPGSFSNLKFLRVACLESSTRCIALWGTCITDHLMRLNLRFLHFSHEDMRALGEVLVDKSPKITRLYITSYSALGGRGSCSALGAYRLLPLHSFEADFSEHLYDHYLYTSIANYWPALSELKLPSQDMDLEKLFRLVSSCLQLSSITIAALCTYEYGGKYAPAPLGDDFVLFCDFIIHIPINIDLLARCVLTYLHMHLD